MPKAFPMRSGEFGLPSAMSGICVFISQWRCWCWSLPGCMGLAGFPTAIEALVNLQTQSYDPLAKVAKDVAAGAVLVLAAAAVGVAFFLFGDLERLRDTVLRIAGEPVFLAALALELVLAVFFIFFWNRRKDLKRKRK